MVYCSVNVNAKKAKGYAQCNRLPMPSIGSIGTGLSEVPKLSEGEPLVVNILFLFISKNLSV